MTSRFRFLAAGLLLALAPITAPAADNPEKDGKGAFLGVLFGPRLDKPAAPDTTGKTTSGAKPSPKTVMKGVVVTHVLPDSPAALAKLRRGDILLEYDGKSIRDGDHLAQLIRDDKPDRKVQLVFQRGASTRTVETKLVLGPSLKLANERRDSEEAKKPDKNSVSVWATPLESGRMKVTIEYYSTGKLQSYSCDTVADLTRTVQKLPERERNLVRIALQRLRSLNSLPARSESAPTRR
jgi:membrane-associated protease RseP (regulator of RpoE activity)